MEKLLVYYLLIINAAGFLIMCVDKLLAKKEARRVPERTLLLIAQSAAVWGVFSACSSRTTKRARQSSTFSCRCFWSSTPQPPAGIFSDRS